MLKLGYIIEKSTLTNSPTYYKIVVESHFCRLTDKWVVFYSYLNSDRLFLLDRYESPNIFYNGGSFDRNILKQIEESLRGKIVTEIKIEQERF